MVKRKIYEVVVKGKRFQIEEDNPDVGVYLYVYENGKCVADYLQDSIQMCMDFALEEYSVSLDLWIEK